MCSGQRPKWKGGYCRNISRPYVNVLTTRLSTVISTPCGCVSFNDTYLVFSSWRETAVVNTPLHIGRQLIFATRVPYWQDKFKECSASHLWSFTLINRLVRPPCDSVRETYGIVSEDPREHEGINSAIVKSTLFPLNLCICAAHIELKMDFPLGT